MHNIFHNLQNMLPFFATSACQQRRIVAGNTCLHTHTYATLTHTHAQCSPRPPLGCCFHINGDHVYLVLLFAFISWLSNVERERCVCCVVCALSGLGPLPSLFCWLSSLSAWPTAGAILRSLTLPSPPAQHYPAEQKARTQTGLHSRRGGSAQ